MSDPYDLQRSRRYAIGSLDEFHSSMTLFARAAGDGVVFDAALRKYFGGKLDRLTLELLPE